MIFDHLKKLFIMKAEAKKVKNFDAVKFMRDARDKITKETEGMNFEQLKSYFEKRKSLAAKNVNPVG